jgi:RpiR family carbohydrate utilization transcriptional regulator
MHAARQIGVAGLGASGHVAGEARHKFFRLGIPCTVLADSPGILQFASIVNGADVLVLISHRGNWPELALAAATARERGAQVIGLTNSTSPLAGQCSIVFDCKRPEDTSIYTPMNSRLAQLALLDAVHVSLALKLGNAASECLRQTKGALTGFLGGERCR